MILDGWRAAGITKSLRKTHYPIEKHDIVDKYLVFKFFVRKPCLITTQIKLSRVLIRVNYYTSK